MGGVSPPPPPNDAAIITHTAHLCTYCAIILPFLLSVARSHSVAETKSPLCVLPETKTDLCVLGARDKQFQGRNHGYFALHFG